MILSQMIFPPKQEDAKKPLYLRGEAVLHGEGGLELPEGAQVRFDTYFNAFFYGAYLRYCHVEQVCAVLITSGTLELTLSMLDQSGRERVLFRRDVSGDEITTSFPACRLAELPDSGALFLVCRARTSRARIHQGWFEAVQTQPVPVKVAAVICTYRREESVRRNLQRLAALTGPGNLISGELDVLVIDNGNSLPPSELSGAAVIPNKNWGGSGGFARGMLEARRRGGYTHVLLMDDDISFESETLVRTIQFLKAARQTERPLCVGGQMLLENQPLIQFESGADYRNGRLVAYGRGLDLSNRRALLENAEEAPAQYNAWWYCCIPVSAIEKYGFPMPFFIKTDDVEYGLRLKPQIVLVNGIGVWHMAFSEKYSPHLEYYIKRNELTASAVHGSGAGVWPGLYKLLKSAAKAFLKGDAHTLCILCRDCRDFLEGPDFFLKTDAEELNQRLLDELKAEPARCWSHVPALLRALGSFALRYGEVRSEYQRRLPELVSGEFWQIRLGCGEEEHDQS